MAKENNEISDIVKKCKILLLDIEGTTTSISFVKDKLFPYAENNVKSFLESHWENEDVKEAVAALRKQMAEDQEKSVEGVVAIPGEDVTKDEQIEGLVKNVQWQMSADRKVGPLKQLQGLIWKLGYDKGEIKGHVYDDVYPALELWLSTDGQKVYIYSSGSVQAQKLLFKKSLAGDMLPLIEGHFDTAVGAKQEPASYATIVEKIGCKAEEILFLTDIDKEAEAARASGLHAALVSREGNAPLSAEAAAAFPVLHSLEQLASSNKRKPDPQVEEVPAKVPKTDIQDDVKTVSETEPESVKANDSAKTTEVEAMETAAVVEKTEESETMEVEETPDATAMEAKDAVETNSAVVETKTAIAEAVDIAEKDVLMEDATVTNASAVDANEVATAVNANSTENAVVKVVSAATAETSTDIETAVGLEVGVPENAKVQKTASEVPNMAEANMSKSVDKPADKVEAKRKMVDAATITENDKEPEALKVVETPAIESKLVDAATETTPVEAVAEKLKTEVAPAEGGTVNAPTKIPETVEIQTNKNITKDAPVTDAISAEAPATKSKEVESHAETKSVEAFSTADIVEKSNKIDDESESKETTDESKPVEVTAIEISEANTIVAKKTDVKEAASVDESVVVETKPVGNGDVKAAHKLEENVVEAAAAVSDKPVEIAIEAALEVSGQNDAIESPKGELVVEEIEDKTEPNETEKMETEVKVAEVEVVMEPNASAEKTQADAITESSVEIEDITDDKQILSEVTDIIDDAVPIVEEPTHLEEMEELQNAGDVLEKECDEILSKVQDVTSLNYMPVKALHTIAEEMETENIDSNDIVDRILDTEIELSMKPDDINLNAVQELDEPKLDADERIGKLEPGNENSTEIPAVEGNTQEKMEVSSDAEMVAEKLNDNKVEIIDEKMETEEETKAELENKVVTEESIKPQEESTKPQEEISGPQEEISEPQESKKETEVPIVVEPTAKTNETEPECKETDISVAITQDTKENNVSQETQKNDATETKVNGKANGDAIVKLNGDTSKDDDLKSRLTAENGKEKVNGSNGDSAGAEIGQGDNKVEAEIPDFKVKTVSTDEPIEQPVEA